MTANGTINSGTTSNLDGNKPSRDRGRIRWRDDPATPNACRVWHRDRQQFRQHHHGSRAGIDAYNYGNGDVSVNDNYGSGAVASTSVSGAVLSGIEAQALSGGTGDVTVNVGTNASISTSNAANALYGILAVSLDTGNIAVTTSTGDDITSASDGLLRRSILPADDIGRQQHHCHGRWHDQFGAQPRQQGFPPAGILAWVQCQQHRIPVSDFNGNVSVTSDATNYAAGGWGIDGFNYGTGNVTVTTAANSSITGWCSNPLRHNVGIAAYEDIHGGNASITNAALVSAATGIALLRECNQSWRKWEQAPLQSLIPATCPASERRTTQWSNSTRTLAQQTLTNTSTPEPLLRCQPRASPFSPSGGPDYDLQ